MMENLKTLIGKMKLSKKRIIEILKKGKKVIMENIDPIIN